MSYVLILALILVVSTVAVGVYGINHELHTGKVKKFMGINLSTFFLLMVATTIVLLSGDFSHAASVDGKTTGDGLKYLAAALSTGLASVGAGIGAGISGSAAIAAISENEKLLGKTLIFVGLGEGVAIYGLIITIMILGQ